MRPFLSWKIKQKSTATAVYSLLMLANLMSSNASAAPLPDMLHTGGPSNPNEAKIAVLVSEKSYEGKAFEVITDKGQTIFTGKLKKAESPQPWSYAATADFSAVTQQGNYVLKVEQLKSRPWEIASHANSALVPKLLGLLQANRDGNEPSPLHKPAHLHDATVQGGQYDKKHIDLTGGWMDAGDQLHFTSTTAYAAIILQIAANLDPSNAQVLRDEADVGIRWLLKAHPFPDLFIGQVGDLRDHDTNFRDPAKDDDSKLPGLADRIAYPSSAAHIMGKTATALALAADRNTGKIRTELLTQAQQWYQEGVAHHIPEPLLPGNAYEDSTWRDDLSLAALMLWRVTGTEHYLKEALDYLTPIDTINLSVSSVAVLAGADLCGTLGHAIVANLKARNQGCELLLSSATEAMSVANTNNAPWGTPGQMSWGQTSRNGAEGAIVALAKRAALIPDATIAARARDWLLGLNPWGVSFVVGYGQNTPTTPHHWASIVGASLPDGSVVGGPVARHETQKAKFLDKDDFNSERAVYSKKLENYVTNEPALDYSVNSILLLAALNTLADQH
jgi:endoglucanase